MHGIKCVAYAKFAKKKKKHKHKNIINTFKING